MRTVVDCVSSFIPLLSTEYEIVLGRKNVAVKLIITFDKKDCFHLMGLQYLTDRPELRRDRGKIFDDFSSLKNIDFKDGKPETVMLEDVKIEWMDMIGQLDDDVKVFLEYPIMEDEIANQINTVKKAK